MRPSDQGVAIVHKRHREAERMEERQNPNDRIVFFDVGVVVDLVNVGQDVAVGEHDALGVTRLIRR